MKKMVKSLMAGLMATGSLIAYGVTWTHALETGGASVAEPHESVSAKNAEWSALQVGREIAGEDDWRGFNRFMFAVQDAAMDYIATPINHVYCSVLP